MSGNSDVPRQYARVQIMTSAAPKLVCMLHNRCVTLVQQSLSQETPSRELLDKAQNIIIQLERSLVINDPVSQGLFYLYDFSYYHLKGLDKPDHAAALKIMTILRDTFDQLLEQSKSEGSEEKKIIVTSDR